MEGSAAIKFALLGAALLTAPGLLLAASLSCSNRIISRGSSQAELQEFCGAPASVSKSTRYTGGGTRQHGAVVFGDEFQAEIWTYNFGPDKLMERVRIENGIVADIQSMGYGLN